MKPASLLTRPLPVSLVWLALFTPFPAPAQDLISAVRQYSRSNQGAIVTQLRELLSIPNVAGDLFNIRRNADRLVSLLRQRGAKARLIETGEEPIVYGEIGDPSKPAILFYCHYDGQPVDPANWAQESPWVPVLRTGSIESGGRIVDRWPGPREAVDPQWRIYARSASDDKAPIVALLSILDAARFSGIELPNRLKFLFEGDEEAGSRHLAEVTRQNKELFSASLAVMADGPIHPSGRPSVFFGLRGLVTVDLTVYGPVRPLHSGHYGNWAPNPAMRLAQLLASMKDAEGNVLVAGWEDDVTPLTAADRAALDRLPSDDEDQRLQFQLGSVDGGGRTRHELITWPSLNIRGLQSLFVGPSARTLIPSVAVASLDIRLVAGNAPERQVAKLVRHLEAQGYTVVAQDPDSALRVKTPRLVKVEAGTGYPAGRTPLDHPAARAVIAALERSGLQEPVVVPTMGGSGPAYVFTDLLGQPFVIVPIVNHDNNQHAENENLRLGNLFRGMEILAAVASASLQSR